MKYLLIFIALLLSSVKLNAQLIHSEIDSLLNEAITVVIDDIPKAKNLVDTALLKARKHDYKDGIKLVTLAQAIIKKYQGENQEAINLSNEFLSNADTTDLLNLGRAYINLSKANESMDNDIEALDQAQNALANFKRIKNIPGIAACYTQIAINYRKQNRYQDARDTYQKGIKLYESEELFPLTADLYGNIGNTYGWEEKYDKAEEYFRKALEIDSTYNNTIGLFYSYENLGNLYGRKRDLQQALVYFTKSLTYIEDTERKEELAIGYQRLGQVNMMTGNYPKAIETFDKALIYAKKANLREAISTIYINKGKSFASQGKFELAYKELIGHQVTSDSLYNVTLAEKISDANAKYETAEKENEIAALKYEEDLAKIKLDRQSEVIAIGGFTILSLGGLLYFVFKQKKKIENQNNIISKSLSEKEILIKEIHHRVKNNLQFISSLLGLQSEHIDDETALGALQEGQDRVQSMALIHQNLYQEHNLTGVDLKDYFKKLIRGLFESYNIRKDKIKLDMNIEDINLDVDTVIPIGLIVNELVSNCLKYAFPNNGTGEIHVSLKEVDERLQIIVSDNGVGIDEQIKETLGSSFGYRLIKVLKVQLKAALNIENNNGTTVTMDIKKYALAG